MTMHLYEIAVRSTKYHGVEPLTYSSDSPLAVGSIVSVPLRNTETLGVVVGKGQLPRGVTAKPITAVHASLQLPKGQLALLEWLRAYYPAPLATLVQLFTPQQIDDIPPTPVKTAKAPARRGLPPLSAEQSAALHSLQSSTTPTALLHGDTGTGKTRVYLELARRILDDQKSVIILVPEIGLTPQIEQIFSEQFPGSVTTIHSGMTAKQRREIWRKIHDESQPQIVIGPRSALFMPLKAIGLIVVDEAHDKGYKQDQLPYYDATRVAAKLAGISDALCLYGTATPRIADYWQLIAHNTPVVRLTEQATGRMKKPTHHIIDAGNRELFSRSSIFSEPMLEAISETLNQGQQSLVFLNRRGTARFVSCSSCGWHAACPICDTPLTYHGDSHQLRCHICGTKESVPTVCPSCGSSELRYQRRGTKALQSELEKLFPEARIARFDSDNTKDESLQSQYKDLANGAIDIIVGTQIVSKGLDLAKLALVCIPQADLSAYLPDFTADEQTFQLLRQVLGRVGRSNAASTVVLQTYTPKSTVIAAAVANDWQSFYEAQLEHRKAYNFPPFAYLLQLTTLRASSASAKNAAQKLIESIKTTHPSVELLGPAPRFHEKVQGKYHWQIVVKATTRTQLLAMIKQLPSGWRYNIDPSDLL